MEIRWLESVWNLYSSEFCAAFENIKIGIHHLRLESWESRIFRNYKVTEFRQAGISLRFPNLQGKIANLRFNVRQVTKCEPDPFGSCSMLFAHTLLET